MLEDYLWVEKYRPKTIDDCILPDELKKTFQQFVDQKNIPNLLLSLLNLKSTKYLLRSFHSFILRDSQLIEILH